MLLGIEDAESSSPALDAGAIPLPDIREARQKKLMEEELARIEEAKEESRVKVKRSDKEAFTKVS